MVRRARRDKKRGIKGNKEMEPQEKEVLREERKEEQNNEEKKVKEGR